MTIRHARLIIAFLLLAGCARGRADTSVVAGSARDTMAARTFRFVLHVENEGDPDWFVQSGMVDLERGLTWMGQGENAEPEMISDGKTTYMLGELQPRSFGATKAWVSYGDGADDDDEGPPFAPYAVQEAIPGQGMSSDPARLLEEIAEGGGRVEKDGEEQVRGVPTTRYRVRLDLERLEERARAASKGELERASAEDREQFEDDLRDAIEHPPALRVWVGEDGLVRKTELEASYPANEDGGPRQSDVTRLEYFDFGAPFTVEVPPPSQVEAFSSLPGVRISKDKQLSPAEELARVSNWKVAGRGTVGERRWTLESGTSERLSVCTRLRFNPPVLVPSGPLSPSVTTVYSEDFLPAPPPSGAPAASLPPAPMAAVPAPRTVEKVESHTVRGVGGGCGFTVHGSGYGDAGNGTAFSWIFGEVRPGADAAKAYWSGGRAEPVELHGVAWAIVGEERPEAVEFHRKGRVLRRCDLPKDGETPGLC